ncbi:hypothetical protein PI124_g19691 [Phytophthora idaei]|nr:hypothetical protein PI125_g7347 [Phytophthora idaei]KAG3133557.1 hypothetical protein PI126_g19126 [Phytophthora idaei]KAG3235273.1 hypothetical protein PI124_g19691 [Phytophthora idaei]
MTAVTTPNAEEASTSATNRARHKELLSFAREMPKLKPLPALTSASLAPLSSAPRDRSPPSSMEFLSNLDQIRIVQARATLRPPLSSVSQLSTATPTTASTSEHEAPERQPDLCVRRRFSDFARLRHEAVAASCVNAHFLCQYCRQLRTYTRFHAAQPLWFVRVMSTKKQRKKILARFLSDFVDFAQSRAQRDRHCRLRQTLPKLIEEFLSE